MNIVKKMFVKKATIDACKSLGAARLRNVLRFKNAIDQDIVVRAWPKSAFRIKVEPNGQEFNLVVLDQAKTEIMPGVGEGMLQKTIGALSVRQDKAEDVAVNAAENKYVLARFSTNEDATAALNELHGKLSRVGVKKIIKVAVALGLAFLVISFVVALFQTSGTSVSSGEATKVSSTSTFNGIGPSNYATVRQDGGAIRPITRDGRDYKSAEIDGEGATQTDIGTDALRTMTEDALKGMGAQAASRQKELADKFNAENGISPNGERSQFAESADINSAFKNAK